MSARLSRRKLAQYTADRLLAGDTEVIQQVAALVVSEGRLRELDLIVHDIEEALAERGTVIATVTSAHSLSAPVRAAVESMIDAKKVVIKEQIDSNVLGGIKVDIPGKRYDGTVKYKLSELRAQKV